MNDAELGELVGFLSALRAELQSIWRDGYRVDISLASSASGDYSNIHVDITIPKQKRS